MKTSSIVSCCAAKTAYPLSPTENSCSRVNLPGFFDQSDITFSRLGNADTIEKSSLLLWRWICSLFPWNSSESAQIRGDGCSTNFPLSSITTPPKAVW